MKARDVKRTVSLICAVLIGSPALAADLELKCKGHLGKITDRMEEGRIKTALGPPIPVEYNVSFSGAAVTVEANPKYDLGGAPFGSVPKLFIKKSGITRLEFESVERSRRSKQIALVYGVFISETGSAHIYWRDFERWGLWGRCEFLVSTRSIVSPGAA